MEELVMLRQLILELYGSPPYYPQPPPPPPPSHHHHHHHRHPYITRTIASQKVGLVCAVLHHA
ncbi:hypothetical protein CsSME_00036685 [Camellia sinensis var. sinensis]